MAKISKRKNNFNRVTTYYLKGGRFLSRQNVDRQKSSVLEMLENRYTVGILSRLQCRKHTDYHSFWFSVRSPSRVG
jgi:hypothetical protein